MEQLGYDDRDAFAALDTLVKWGLVEPESLLLEKLSEDDPIRVHSSGFIHFQYFLNQPEYVIAITPDMNFSSRETAENLGSIWASQTENDISLNNKARIASTLASYFKDEYERRCRRHAFYDDVGFGGRYVVNVVEQAREYYAGLRSSSTSGYPVRRRQGGRFRRP
jgi:hypothetical protein